MPEEVELVRWQGGLRLRGPGLALAVGVTLLRQLGDQPEWTTVPLGDWTLVVSDSVYEPEDAEIQVVSLPANAWRVAASVLRDATFGGYGPDRIMDFGDVGYLTPRPAHDVGVEIVGDFASGSYATDDELREAYEAHRG